MTMKQVYSETVLMTDLLNEKTARSFSTWCGTAKLDLTLADQTHKMQKTDDSKTKIRYRFLWVLKGIHRESVARQILNVSATHQDRLHGYRSEGCTLIGYIRKLPGKKSARSRRQLLDSMVDKLTKNSSVDMVFGSYSSSASDELFTKRDTTTTTTATPRTKGNT
ncbi:unnamed protein product [Mucor circinelloides]